MSSMTSKADRRAMQRGGRQPRRAWLPAARLPVRRETRKSAVYSMPRGGATYRTVTDNQVSVRLVVNAATGEVAQRLDYDSFGRVLCDTNTCFQPFGFQGGLYDPDTGLVEFGCRWYDAETGRWISKDPILLEGGWNVYAFCGSDPVNRTDPSGLWAWIDDAIFAGGGALCGLVGKLVTDVASYCMGNGWNSTIGDYVGVTVGGAVVGETLLYTANPVLAGAAGGCVANITGQSIDVATGAKDSIEFMPLLTDTVIGAATGYMPGVKKAGVTTGRGSCLQISKQMRTKSMNNLKNVTTPIIKDKIAFAPTAFKMFKGEYYDKAILPCSIAGSALSWTASTMRGWK